GGGSVTGSGVPSRGSVSGTAVGPSCVEPSPLSVRSRLRKSRERPGDSSVTHPTYGPPSGTRRKTSPGASGGRQSTRVRVVCSVLPTRTVAQPAYRKRTRRGRTRDDDGWVPGDRSAGRPWPRAGRHRPAATPRRPAGTAATSPAAGGSHERLAGLPADVRLSRGTPGEAAAPHRARGAGDGAPGPRPRA